MTEHHRECSVPSAPLGRVHDPTLLLAAADERCEVRCGERFDGVVEHRETIVVADPELDEFRGGLGPALPSGAGDGRYDLLDRIHAHEHEAGAIPSVRGSSLKNR